MDHDSLTQPASSPALTTSFSPIESSLQRLANTDLTSSPFSPEASPTRQQRLLQNRNARFPAKKLSISGISSKLTQLIGTNDHTAEANIRLRDQENNGHSGWNNNTVSRRSGLSVLEEISNTARNRSARRRVDIHIYQDTPERPLLQSSPYIASSPNGNAKHDLTSPLELGHVPDSLDEMRTKQLSSNDRWSALDSSPPELKSNQRKRSGRLSYDQEEYIKHLEDRLHQLEQDAYSPMTRRPMKEKLMIANKENERLQKELGTLKEKFETEVKRTVEHKTAIEMELRKRVRDLEYSLERKEAQILEMQYQYTEERLDDNTIETLKLTIERLEQEKLNMEETHLSMSKRNETLTKLVASGMSPPKTGSFFDNASPNREKRNPRMSLILPKMPSSPNGSQHYSYSATASPVLPSSCDVSPLRLSTENAKSYSFEGSEKSYFDPRSGASTSNDGSLCSPAISRPVSRRSTMNTEAPMLATMCSNINTNTTGEIRPPTKRKARRFLAGSTQLKPLLLPALTSEPASLTSTPSANFPEVSLLDTSLGETSDSDIELTIIAAESTAEIFNVHGMSDEQGIDVDTDPEESGGHPGPAYTVEDDELSGTLQELLGNQNTFAAAENFLLADMPLSDETEQGSQESYVSADGGDPRSPELELWSDSPDQDPDNHFRQEFMKPGTTDSVGVVPLPLFSPVHLHNAYSSMPSRTPSESSQSPVRVRKKRQISAGDSKQLPRTDQALRYIERISSPLSKKISCNRGHYCGYPVDSSTTRIKSSDNFLEFLHQKNFAVKPFASIAIRTLYRTLSTCTSAVRGFQKDPSSLARRVLANIWQMNWKVMGKLSWWVLGLFIHPRSPSKTHAAIEWDRYNIESIADRYCNLGRPDFVSKDNLAARQADDPRKTLSESPGADHDSAEDSEKPGLIRSILLWGKFSAAIMLAVSGAILKGPHEMMKITTSDKDNLDVQDQQACCLLSTDKVKTLHLPQTPQKNHGFGRMTMRDYQWTDHLPKPNSSPKVSILSSPNNVGGNEENHHLSNIVSFENAA